MYNRGWDTLQAVCGCGHSYRQLFGYAGGIADSGFISCRTYRDIVASFADAEKLSPMSFSRRSDTANDLQVLYPQVKYNPVIGCYVTTQRCPAPALEKSNFIRSVLFWLHCGDITAGMSFVFSRQYLFREVWFFVMDVTSAYLSTVPLSNRSLCRLHTSSHSRPSRRP
jgi:hypothetical protein